MNSCATYCFIGMTVLLGGYHRHIDHEEIIKPKQKQQDQLKQAEIAEKMGKSTPAAVVTKATDDENDEYEYEYEYETEDAVSQHEEATESEDESVESNDDNDNNDDDDDDDDESDEESDASENSNEYSYECKFLVYF